MNSPSRPTSTDRRPRGRFLYLYLTIASISPIYHREHTDPPSDP